MRLVAFLLALLAGVAVAMAQTDLNPDDILIDATFVTCSDTTESLLVLRDGRAIYAHGKRGSSLSIAGALLNDLKRVIDSCHSVVETNNLDSCNTIGVILEGPRYILLNPRRPSAEVRNLHNRLERLRTYARRRMEGTIDKFTEHVEAEPDPAIGTLPSVAPSEIRRKVQLSPIAREWRCGGTVTVAAMITYQGKVRQAFIRDVRTRGKCASVLSIMALRAVLLSKFEPATKDGKPVVSWIEIEVPFSRPK